MEPIRIRRIPGTLEYHVYRGDQKVGRIFIFYPLATSIAYQVIPGGIFTRVLHAARAALRGG